MASKAASITKATGTAWTAWDEWLTEQGAQELPHPDIARLALKRVHELGITHHAANGKPFNDGWWAQTIAIEYGHQHGLREKGQLSAGDHAVSASKKVVGSLDELLDRWLALVAGQDAFDGVVLAEEPRVSSTEKWRYWRAKLSDGSTVKVDVSADRIAIQHAGLASTAEGERWRPYWKARLSDLA
ncbi:hypothetical protein H1W00_12365 [Aeromicrobium sp. Marseille-Q0843]|uniref:Uncharacterized protein n=1 Tax=Aeromicrobium phoceense TaxID=2754045 RepID=A0A838XFF4_9ACTN|nr:hypothetical protein [Aeromicrobium phoceense]MBA4609275.1 hypothetical protein [Aeromicrobium phoceense]